MAMAEDGEEKQQQNQQGPRPQRLYKGMHTDNSPQDQPEGTWRYALNASIESDTGDFLFIGNANSNNPCGGFSAEYTPIGKVYVGDDKTVIFLVKERTAATSTVPATYISEIGIHNAKSCSYTPIINDGTASNDNWLNFNPAVKISAEYRLRRGCERMVYFTTPVPMAINLDKPEKYKIDNLVIRESLLLFKQIDTIPSFKNIEVLRGGQLLPGSYNFAIQLLDADFNPTFWMTVSDTVIIYNDDHLSLNYHTIRGSVNLPAGTLQDFGTTSKSIRLEVENLHVAYPYWRVACICSNVGNGTISNVLVSNEIPREIKEFVYDGTNATVKSTIEEIEQFNSAIKEVKYLAQENNRMLYANTSDIDINYCELQAYASKIKVDLDTKRVFLTDLTQLNNPKRPAVHTESVGYMPGEIYSLGIVYVFKGGIESPVCHIPGNPGTDNNGALKPGGYTSKMSKDNWLGSSETVPTIPYSGNGWGKYSDNTTALKDKVIRHHRFPLRSELNRFTDANGRTFVKASDENSKFKPVYNIDVHLNTIGMMFKFYNGYFFGTTYELNSNAHIVTILYFDYGNLGETLERRRVEIDHGLVSDYYTGFNVAESNQCETYWLQPGSSNAVTGWNLAFNSFYEKKEELHNLDKPATNFRLTVDVGFGEWVPTDRSCQGAGDIGLQGKNRGIEAPPTGLNATITLRTDTFTQQDMLYDSYMFGLKIDNVLLPQITGAPPCIGFYIVRNERNEATKTILDTGVTFPILLEDYDKTGKGSLYASFGHLMPNFGDNFLSKKSKYAFAFTHPEFRIRGREYTYADEFIIEGKFKLEKKEIKTDAKVEDIMDGTSYVKGVSADNEADVDGWDLDMLVRNNIVGYSMLTTPIKLKADETDNTKKINKIVYLNALTYINVTATGQKSNDIYNLSADNKIGVFTLAAENAVLGEIVPAAPKTATMPATPNYIPLFYFTLKRKLTTVYSDFRSMPYYRDSKFIPFPISAPIYIYNGDSYISASKQVSSVFIEAKLRKRNTESLSFWEKALGVMNFLVGATLIILAPFTGGATLAPGFLALKSSLDTLSTGLKLADQEKVYNELYEAGLKTSVNDKDFDDNRPKGDAGNPTDDEMRWLIDCVSDLWFESQVNLNWRSGFNAGFTDFINAPKLFTSDSIAKYARNKMCVPNNARKGGYSYRGTPVGEWYFVNPDYFRRERQKIHEHLPIEYQCESDCREKFPLRIHYSEQSFQEELTDNYRTVLPNNYRDIPGETGEITAIYDLENGIYVHTQEALWMLSTGMQERVTGDIVSFIGTGSYLSVPPVKIIDDETGMSGGCVHNWGTIKTQYGVFFVCYKQRKFYKLQIVKSQYKGGATPSLASINGGMDKWISKNMKFTTEAANDTPNIENGNGFISTYDSVRELIYFTKKEYINTNNKSWTLVYSLKLDGWMCFMSLTPDFYFNTPNRFFSFDNFRPSTLTATDPKPVYIGGVPNKFLKYDGGNKPFIIEYVILANPLQTKVWNAIKILTEAKKYDANGDEYDLQYVTFTKAILYNSRQCSGLLTLKSKNMDAVDFFNESIASERGVSIIRRGEKDWDINDFRDMVIKRDAPMFKNEIKPDDAVYGTDKTINILAVDPLTKDWTEQEVFRDKYLIVRLIFDNFEDVKLLMNYSLSDDSFSAR